MNRRRRSLFVKLSTRTGVALAAFLAILNSNGSQAASWHTERAFEGFVPGMQVLAEVTVIAPAKVALRGKGLFKGWKSKLLAVGYTEADIQDGSEISVWAYCYAHNGAVGACANHGQFLAHVPPELRQVLRSEENNPSGDLVVIELSATPEGDLVGLVRSVYRGVGDWRDCRVEHLKPSSALKLGLLGPGPPEGLWLECANAEADGWTRRPVVGAPFSEGSPVSMWVRPPRAGE